MIYRSFRCWLLRHCMLSFTTQVQCAARIVYVCWQQMVVVLNLLGAPAKVVVQDACDTKVMRA
jgi:hypothetical protein